VLINNRLLEKHPDDKEMQRILKQQITLKSRDNARTPMQVRHISIRIWFLIDRNSVE
jgi:hypothetical protein